VITGTNTILIGGTVRGIYASQGETLTVTGPAHVGGWPREDRSVLSVGPGCEATVKLARAATATQLARWELVSSRCINH